MDRGRGREAHLLADLAHRGRVPPLAHVLLDDLQDRQLAVGEVVVGHAPPPNRCLDEATVARSPVQGKHLFVYGLDDEQAFVVSSTNRGSIVGALGRRAQRRAVPWQLSPIPVPNDNRRPRSAATSRWSRRRLAAGARRSTG